MTLFFIFFPLFTDILFWKNVAGAHGNELIAVWMLSDIPVEIILAYNPLNLGSIFTVTKISTNVFNCEIHCYPNHFSLLIPLIPGALF